MKHEIQKYRKGCTVIRHFTSTMEDKPEVKLHEKVLEYNLRFSYFQKVEFGGGWRDCCVLIKYHRVVLSTQKCCIPKGGATPAPPREFLQSSNRKLRSGVRNLSVDQK